MHHGPQRGQQLRVLGAREREREHGTHDELLDHDGIYSRLWRVQTGERLAFEDEEPEGVGVRTVS